jgi:23S rRNA (uracil1939-C5)-methyltransferase
MATRNFCWVLILSERVTIARMGHRGDGIADSPAGPIYVPYALSGETVDVEPVAGHPDRRRLLAVHERSAERVDPICPHFGICGGCAVQHWTTTSYHAWKRDLVVRALAGVGMTAQIGDLIDAHGEGRRRVVLHARRGTHESLTVGFAAFGTHHIVPIDQCPILSPGLDRAISTAWMLSEALADARKPLDIHMTATDVGIDVDIRGSGPLSPPSSSDLASIALSQNLARLTRHGEFIAQRSPPTIQMGRAQVALPPGAFLQATAEGEVQLAQRVLDYIGRAKHIADLFAGLGPFTLRLAERSRVTAIDSDTQAIAALKRAAAGVSGLKPITADVRDLFRRPLMASELTGFDAIVFDPPRQGAEAQVRQIAASRVPLVVAVSCNPATFARDAKILIDGGYRLSDVVPVDQFRFAAHVEIVARFDRKN